MQFKLLSALAFAALSLADSDVISLLTLRSGTAYHLNQVTVLDDVLSLSSDGTAVEGKILDNGKFEFSDGSGYLKVGDDGSLSVTSSSDDASSPFSIYSRYFQYQDSQAFNVNLNDSQILFGSGENPVALGATDKTSSDSFAPDFTPSGADSSSSAVSSSSVTSGYFNSTSTTTEGSISTTVITITSCSEDKCSETPVTTGVTVVTTTSEGIVTEYTTYCPLTSESTPATSAPETTTEAPTSKASTLVSTSTGTTSEPTVSTFDNGAAALSGSGAIIAIAVALLI